MEKFYNATLSFNGKEVHNEGMTETELQSYISSGCLALCIPTWELTEMNVNIVLANPELPFPKKDSFTFA